MPTAYFVALRPLFPFWQIQFVEVFPLKPAPFYKLSARLGNINKSIASIVLSFSQTLALSSRHNVLSVFPFTSNSLALLAETVFSLLLYYQATMVSRTLIFSGNNAADELASRSTLLLPSTIPCILSFLTSFIHSSLFSEWRRIVSSKFFDTQVPSMSTDKLVLPRLACCVLSRFHCYGHSVLDPSCSACVHSIHDISHLILYCPTVDSFRRFLFGTSFFSTTSGAGPGEFSGFWGSMVSGIPLFLGRDRVETTTKQVNSFDLNINKYKHRKLDHCQGFIKNLN